MENKTVLIYGATGQTASYLSELMIEKSYDVIGVKRRTSTTNTQNLTTILNHPNFSIIEGDIIDPSSVNYLINTYKPDICVCAAAQSHVHTSFSQPSYTFEVNAKGPLLVLEAIRLYSPQTKFLQFSTSEMFGSNFSEEEDLVTGQVTHYQDENTHFSPNSPYAVAKVAAHHLVNLYRNAYNIWASAAICFNNESERRNETFVTRKITKWIADNMESYTNRVYSNGPDKPTINTGKFVSFQLKKDYKKLKLGNIDAIRDWSHSLDTVTAVYLMLQQDKPDDYIIGTGKAHSIKEFLDEAFGLVGLDWKDFVEIDPSLYRPCEVPYLRCDNSKAKKVLGWEPQIGFKELVYRMVQGDINAQKT